jgi:SAM-dependent methyltransferase
MLHDCLDRICTLKKGLEIGGPSPFTCTKIYKCCETIDNVVFHRNTHWAKLSNDTYTYFENKTGSLFIHDAVHIQSLKDASYDFVVASHSLEHIANPIKALKEWLRLIKTDGYIILILPERSKCFDHKRNVSKLDTLLAQYSKNVGEDDLSTLPEILEHHDLSRDPAAGTPDQFVMRSLENYKNRCLHHYVYSPDLLKEICTYLGCTFVFTETHGLHIWFIMKKI